MASARREACRHGELVDEVVHVVAGVALDPPERDVAALVHGVDQRLPQITVRDRFLLRVAPVSVEPALPPPIPEAVYDVAGVADHDQRSVERGHRLEGSLDFHPLVGRCPLRAGGPPAAIYGPGPPARARVPAACAIGIHRY